MSEWQPIKTAPMDGTAILLWPYVHFEFWRGKSTGEVTLGFFSEVHQDWYSSELGETFSPTHWMPLPKPPAETTP
jgi:hypothetical protein